MGKALPWLLLAGFVAVLAQRMQLTMTQSGVYPEYSTLRADPSGAKALYEVLNGMPGLRVSRNYRPWAEAKAAGGMHVYLGASPTLLNAEEKWKAHLADGGAALIALRPPPKGIRLRTEKQGFVQTQEPGNAAMLALRGNVWRCLDGIAEACRIAERKMGNGRILMASDATALANRALRDGADTALLAELFPASGRLVFDESHLGVEDSGGVGVLARQYGLMPGLSVLLLAAGLFIWRKGTTLLPEREMIPAALEPKPSASLETLLAQTVPSSKLLDTLAGEWRRALPLMPVWNKGREAALDTALEQARMMKDRKEAYRHLQAAVTLRKDKA